jgi:hypothetical protein
VYYHPGLTRQTAGFFAPLAAVVMPLAKALQWPALLEAKQRGLFLTVGAARDLACKLMSLRDGVI